MDAYEVIRLSVASALAACLCLHCILAGLQSWNEQLRRRREQHETLLRRLTPGPKGGSIVEDVH